MTENLKSRQQLLNEAKELRARLEEAEETIRAIRNGEAEDTIRAIRNGEVDALVVAKSERLRTLLLTGADFPYQAMIESMGEGALTLIPDGTIYFCNPRFAEIVQWPFEKLIGKRFLDLIPPEEQDGWAVMLMTSGKDITRREFRLQTEQTTYVPVQVTVHLLNTEDIEAFIIVVTDLTERKQREHAQWEAEHKLIKMFQSMVDGMVVVDLSGEINYANPAAERILEIKKDEIIGKYFSSHEWKQIGANGEPYSPEQLPLAIALREQREVNALEHGITAPDGEIKWLSVNASPLVDESGQLFGAIASFRDVTEQKRAAEALRVSEEKFRLAFETSPDAVSISRLKDGLYVSVNQGYEHTFGYRAAELIGKTSLDLAVWEEPKNRQEFVAALLATGKVENFEARFRIKSGDLLYGQVSGALIHLHGEPHLFNITRDITERMEMKLAMQEYNTRLETEVAQRTHQLGIVQEKLLRQERLATLGQVAGSIAHELRNPLGVITNAVYFLNLIAPQAEPRVQEYLTIIEQETRYAEQVVSNLLDQSRIKLPDRRQIAVIELVQQALDRNPLAPNILLTQDIPTELPPVYVDPVQIVQVLGNLLSNAYQAMPDGGCLTFAARQDGQVVAIKVIDHGVGIAAEYMPRLFEPLFTTKQKGIGLGLSLSKNLVESNDGRIDVFSEAGQGSTFVVFLPVVGSMQEKENE